MSEGGERPPGTVFPVSALIGLSLAEESQAQALSELVPDMVEQGGGDEVPEDNLEILSLTSPDLEQSLKDAVKFGERDPGQDSWHLGQVRQRWTEQP